MSWRLISRGRPSSSWRPGGHAERAQGRRNLSGSLNQPAQRLDAFTLKADRLALGEWSSLSLSLSGAQGAADKPTLAGTLEGTLKARLDENRQLLEISDGVLAAKLSGDALPRPQMQVKLAGFARAELDKQASPSATW